MISRLSGILAGTVAMISICSVLLAQESKSNIKVEVKLKQVSGIITSVSPSFIAVEAGVNEGKTAALEAAFNLKKGVRIIHKNSLQELNIGDTVTVSYEETIKKIENGKKSRSTNVISITFLKPAPKDLMPQDQPQAPRDSTASSETQNEDALSIKGLKGR
jgi:hypothetical protein